MTIEDTAQARAITRVRQAEAELRSAICDLPRGVVVEIAIREVSPHLDTRARQVAVVKMYREL